MLDTLRSFKQRVKSDLIGDYGKMTNLKDSLNTGALDIKIFAVNLNPLSLVALYHNQQESLFTHTALMARKFLFY